jgi:hypothetical protein
MVTGRPTPGQRPEGTQLPAQSLHHARGTRLYGLRVESDDTLAWQSVGDMPELHTVHPKSVLEVRIEHVFFFCQWVAGGGDGSEVGVGGKVRSFPTARLRFSWTVRFRVDQITDSPLTLRMVTSEQGGLGDRLRSCRPMGPRSRSPSPAPRRGRRSTRCAGRNACPHSYPAD